MEGGDIATWDSPHTILVLEGVLARVPTTQRRRRFKDLPLPPAASWEWSMVMLKKINQMARQYNALFDAVTFLGQEQADLASEYLANHEVRVTGCVYDNYTVFCESLKWRDDVARVIDSDHDRLMFYGQRGYELPFGVEL